MHNFRITHIRRLGNFGLARMTSTLKLTYGLVVLKLREHKDETKTPLPLTARHVWRRA